MRTILGLISAALWALIAVLVAPASLVLGLVFYALAVFAGAATIVTCKK